MQAVMMPKNGQIHVYAWGKYLVPASIWLFKRNWYFELAVFDET